MKFLKIFIILFIALSFALSADVIPTSPPPCAGQNCDDDEWELHDWIMSGLPQCPDCEIHVWVKVNEDCKEMYLQSYQFTNEACTDCFSNEDWTWADVNREIIIKLIVEGPLSPSYPTGETIIKVNQGACWKPGGSMMNPWEFQPCGGSSCCLRTYKVIKQAGQVPTYSYLGGQLIGDACVSPCFSICDLEIWYPTIIILENKDIDNKSIFKSKAFPNPNTGQALLSYECKDIGNVEFILTDINGKIVLKIQESKSSINDNLKLDMNNLNSGTYYYQLIINDKSISKGSIIIYK